METRLPIPRNWQDFETLCLDLWKEIWNDSNAQRHGRSGQTQHGVDIFGQPLYKKYFAGVQCKDKDSQLRSCLTTKEIEEECKKALSFSPALSEFTIATTAPRDASIQLHARKLTHSKTFPFEVSIWSWNDIEEALRCRPTLVKYYYPDAVLFNGNVARTSLSFISYPEQCEAFFGFPEIKQRIPDGLRLELMLLGHELSANAYQHGGAAQFSIICNHTHIMFEDDGTSFNPLIGLDKSKASMEKNMGSHAFHMFCKRYESDVRVSYERVSSDGKEINRLQFKFSKPLRLFDSSSSEIAINFRDLTTRSGAERLAAQINLQTEATKFVLNVVGVGGISPTAEFIRSLLGRIPPDKKLIISFPNLEPLQIFKELLHGKNVEIYFRE